MKRLHLICNAHVDPIWQWTWDEGISAAIATFQSAADLAEEFDYVFCHGESLLYEEIEKHAPQLFERIRALVKRGKWVITGGWYLQPDCLFPCGESFVRQIETGREYFDEKFGVRPFVATNYDSFGYSVGLPQILKKCGYRGMLVCRPNSTQFTFPSRFFKWVSPDGSEIVVSQSSSYATLMGLAKEKITAYMQGGERGMLGSQSHEQREAEEIDYVLWGVGNHGGGPSRKDLRDIEELQKSGLPLVHSTPERLFSDEIRIGGEVRRSLVTCMPGCYTSMMRLKRAHRETENLFYATEKMLAVAAFNGYSFDAQAWKEAQKHLLLAQFHDVLPGTTVESASADGMEALHACLRTVKEYRSAAFLYLTLGEERAREGEFPVFVFNYAPYEVRTVIEAEFSLADQNWSEDFQYVPTVYEANGTPVPCQTVKEESTLTLDWRKRVAFEGRLQPLGVTRFTVRVERRPVEKRERAPRRLEEWLQDTPLRAPIGLEVADDTADPWGMSPAELQGLGKNSRPLALLSRTESAAFCGFDGEIEPIHTVEDGDVYTAVECLYGAGRTRAAMVYKKYKNQPYIDVEAQVEYSEKNKLVRLNIPVPQGVVVGDGPYVVEEKPTAGEITFQKWVGVKTERDVFAVLNDGVYGGSAQDGYLRMTLLRGAGYCIHPIGERELYPTDRYLPRIENGRYTYRFRIMRGDAESIATAAEEFNQPPYALNVFPIGGAEGKKTFVRTDSPVVTPVCRWKDGRAELRVFNPVEKEKSFVLEAAGRKKEIRVPPYAVVSVDVDEGISLRDDLLR